MKGWDDKRNGFDQIITQDHAGWEVHMKGRFRFFIMLMAVTFGGCAVKVVDVETTLPNMEMSEKFPLRVAVLIREPSLTLDTVTTERRNCGVGGSTNSFTKYPFGKTFEEASRAVFSQMFTQIEVVHQLSISKEYDLVMEANLDQISNRPGCGLTQKGSFQAEGSLRLLNRDLNELWISKENIAEESYGSGIAVFEPSQVSAALSKSMLQSIVSLVHNWGKELKSSLVLYKYTKSLQNVQRVTVNFSEGAPVAASLISDVDDIPQRKTPEKKNAYAIVIGVEQYRQQLPHAEFAASDAQTTAQYLIKTLGYPEHNVVVLLNEHAAKSDFEKYFEKWLPNNVEANSTVFVYYSGHGAPNPKNGDAYLVPYDGDPSFIEQTGYQLKRLYAALGKLPAKEIIVALDSCFSGAGGRSVLAKGTRPLVMSPENAIALSQNMTVLCAASGEQISSTYGEKGHGLFTYFMLKGIKNEDVIKPDGSIAISDLFGYIKPQVEQIARKQFNNEQSPHLIEPNRR